MKRWARLLLSIVTILFVTACGDATDSTSPGDAAAGEVLFSQSANQDAPACTTCHSPQPGKVIIGPSLAGVGSRAGERIPGMAAQDYLRQSILEPNAYVVEGFSPGVMYQKFGYVFTDSEITDLVAYLLTLE